MINVEAIKEAVERHNSVEAESHKISGIVNDIASERVRQIEIGMTSFEGQKFGEVVAFACIQNQIDQITGKPLEEQRERFLKIAVLATQGIEVIDAKIKARGGK